MLINDGWSFVKLPAGSTLEDAENAAFTPVDLPHDWLIWQEKDLYETADAWYCRTIILPEDHEPVVMIRFDGVYMDCDVLLNGELICSHPYGYTAFDAELTGRLQPGENRLMVHIRHRSPNSRWYSGSGIYRDVWLVTYPEDHLIPDSLYMKETETEGRWRISISAETAGNGKQPFTCTINDQDGHPAGTTEGRCPDGRAEAELIVDSARTWSPEDPYLYTLELHYGTQTVTRRIGLRSVFADPESGLILNGKRIRLKGVCLHHDLGALGAAFHEKAARRQLRVMKEMGANAVRTSHNPPASRFLDLCDEMGILVADEAFDMWERPKTEYDYARFFPEWYEKDVASWIRRDRCHPCVIMWSIGNEIFDMHADMRGTEVTKILAQEVRKHDPLSHAFVTFGCNYMPWEGGQRCAEYVDAVGYNYGERLYEKHHEEHPSWVIYGSETGSMLSSRGIYHFPMEQSIMSDADQQCSALGNSNTSWGADDLKKLILDDLNHPFSLGQFIWSGIDYIGEPTPYHTRSCYFGQADTACFPKDAYYLFRSFWTEEKMIHIGVHWDWNEGQVISIPVMTNCAEAELFLDGVSLGRKKTDMTDPERCQPVWKTLFHKGTLTAAGYDSDGRKICEDTRITPGETDHFTLVSEDDHLLADGWDITFVTVTAEDRAGCPVDNARDRLKITVSGGGCLLGTDNGDSTDQDGYKSDCRRLFSGRLLLIIGSFTREEDIRIRVCDSQGRETAMTIPVLKAEPKQGISRQQSVFRHDCPMRIPARKLDICAEESTRLSPEHPSCSFRYRILPAEASDTDVCWQVTNAAGIETPFVKLKQDHNRITVSASGDGAYYLRGLCGTDGACEFISQLELSAEGFGNPALNPYEYISAGLYDLHEGEIGTGNEKGIAFARDGGSMVGFSCVDFGKTGSDRITVDIFALDSEPYEIELWSGKPGEACEPVSVLRYQKPCIWNEYQPETWTIPVRLKGIQSLYFRMRSKVHMKGFSFEKKENAYMLHDAADADSIYGDCFRVSGNAVCGIGNNVTLTWNDMDFGGAEQVELELEGSTPLTVNTVNVRVRNDQGAEITTAADYRGGSEKQKFLMEVPDGICSVAFVFLPGSSFDFRTFLFSRTDNWTEENE